MSKKKPRIMYILKIKRELKCYHLQLKELFKLYLDMINLQQSTLRTNECALRNLYQDYNSSFDQLLARARSITVDHKNLRSLLIEIYKTMNHLNRSYISEFFVKKDILYNLRTKELCRLPSAQSHRYGLNSLSFRGSLLCNA